MSLNNLANGDLERAFKALAPKNSCTEERIAAMLGFTPQNITPASIVTGATLPESMAAASEEGLVSEEKGAGRTESPLKPEGDPLPTILRQIKEAVAVKAPDWLTETTPLEETEGAEVKELPPPPSLLAPEQTRSILTLALSTAREQGPIMVDPLVEAIACGKALRHLTRAMVPSMARGVQLLVDRSEAMMPFLADLDQIEEDIQAVFGKMLKVLSFVCCPLQKAGEGPRASWSDYFSFHVPVGGTRVICVTDLGIGRPIGGPVPAEPEEWLEFQEQLRKHGCSLLILIPYGSSRWHPRLAKRLNILHWDRKTNPARASSLIGRQP